MPKMRCKSLPARTHLNATRKISSIGTLPWNRWLHWLKSLKSAIKLSKLVYMIRFPVQINSSLHLKGWLLERTSWGVGCQWQAKSLLMVVGSQRNRTILLVWYWNRSHLPMRNRKQLLPSQSEVQLWCKRGHSLEWYRYLPYSSNVWLLKMLSQHFTFRWYYKQESASCHGASFQQHEARRGQPQAWQIHVFWQAGTRSSWWNAEILRRPMAPGPNSKWPILLCKKHRRNGRLWGLQLRFPRCCCSSLSSLTENLKNVLFENNRYCWWHPCERTISKYIAGTCTSSMMKFKKVNTNPSCYSVNQLIFINLWKLYTSLYLILSLQHTTINLSIDICKCDNDVNLSF